MKKERKIKKRRNKQNKKKKKEGLKIIHWRRNDRNKETFRRKKYRDEMRKEKSHKQ